MHFKEKKKNESDPMKQKEESHYTTFNSTVQDSRWNVHLNSAWGKPRHLRSNQWSACYRHNRQREKGTQEKEIERCEHNIAFPITDGRGLEKGSWKAKSQAHAA